MDVMQIRRMMMQMIGGGDVGADFIKGTFTIPSDATGSYTLNFGKAFNKYLFFIELTDASKATVVNSGVNSYRPFCFIGSFPQPQMNNVNIYGGNAWTFNPSLNGGANTRYNTNAERNTTTSIIIPIAEVTGTASICLMKGLSYNYYIFEIE